MRQTRQLSSLFRFVVPALLVWIIVLWQTPAMAAEAGTAVKIGTGIVEKPAAEVNINWDDAWFAEDATMYCHELALSSMALSGAAYVREDRVPCVQGALAALGFEKIESYHYQFTLEPGDQVAYTFGMKKVKNQNGKTVRLVAVVVRGTGEYTEWASNLNVGDWSDHTGFAGAMEELLGNLGKYLSKAGITERSKDATKFLMTGHSRGGAVANLLAARLPEEGWAKKENIYGYTFAAPAVSTDAEEEGYENIFNIVNEDDLVPQVPLSAWGYHRYGVDLPLPTGDSGLFEKMNQEFNALTGQSYTSYRDPKAAAKITGALYRLIPSTSGVNMEMFAALLSGDFEGLSALVKGNGFAALLLGKTAIDLSSELTPLIQNEQGALRSAHCMAGYYSWLSVSGELLREREAGE